MMTENFKSLLMILTSIEEKIFEFDVTKKDAYSSNYILFIKTKRDLLNLLEDKMHDELLWISEKFSVGKSEALVLSTIIILYIKNVGIRTNFITYADIEIFLGIDFIESSIIFALRNSIYELEQRNIIEIKDVKYRLVEIAGAQNRQGRYNVVPAKPTFVPFANKKIELTSSLINKLNFL